MDQRLQEVLESLLRNLEVLNEEVMRLGRTEQFKPTPLCFQLIERIRGSCTCSLQNVRTIERRMQARAAEARPAAIIPLDRKDV